MGNIQLKNVLRAAIASLLMAGLLSGCPIETYDDAKSAYNSGGSGGGGSGGGNPPPPPPPPPPPGASFGPVFSEIQAGLFTPTCTSCHGGATPQAGLNLEAASSYASLVGINSSQDPALQLVNPGNPDISYLVNKLEATAAVGTVMPPSGGIAQVDIDMVRQWITDGAIDDTVVVADPITVTSLTPAPNASLTTAPTQVVAGFSRDLDVSTVNDMTFVLTASGGDGTFNSGNEVQIMAASISVPGGNPSTAVFDLTGAVLLDDTYRVTLFGAGANVIMDLDANALDGELITGLPSGNGVAGGDFVSLFSVTTPIVIGPTLDQIQAVVFGPKCSSCHSGNGSTSGINDMDLRNAASSLATLVNVTSAQDSNFTRVIPGDPANSYVVHKLQGVATVGGAMPPTGMLPAAEISAIEQWITDGALP